MPRTATNNAKRRAKPGRSGSARKPPSDRRGETYTGENDFSAEETGSRAGIAVRRAYEIIGAATPILADCGKLCGAACCEGNTRETQSGMPSADAQGDDGGSGAQNEDCELGMFLFPGEYDLLSREPGYRFFRVPFMGGLAWFMVCEGVCDRRKRPLACRMFPLAPHVNDLGKTEALPDPRAGLLCPLADCDILDPAFRGAVEKAFSRLAREPEILEYMKLLSAELEEMRQFKNFLNFRG